MTDLQKLIELQEENNKLLRKISENRQPKLTKEQQERQEYD